MSSSSEVPAIVICNSLEAKFAAKNTLEPGLTVQGSHRGFRNTCSLIEIMNFLVESKVKKILLFCIKVGKLVEQYVKENFYNTKRISMKDEKDGFADIEIRIYDSLSQHCNSTGDALREIHRSTSLQSWLLTYPARTKPTKHFGMKTSEARSSDFILVRSDSFVYGSFDMEKEIRNHQCRRKKNPRLLFSLLSTSEKTEYRCTSKTFGSTEPQQKNTSVSRSTFTAILACDSDYLLGWFPTNYFIKIKQAPNHTGYRLVSQSLRINAKKAHQIEAKGQLLSENDSTIRIRSGVVGTGIAICSLELCAVMKENFDFLSLDDCIHTYVLLSDHSRPGTAEAYENDEVSRAINQYDIRVPTVSIDTNIRRPVITSCCVEESLQPIRLQVFQKVNKRQIESPIPTDFSMRKVLFSSPHSRNVGHENMPLSALSTQLSSNHAHAQRHQSNEKKLSTLDEFSCPWTQRSTDEEQWTESDRDSLEVSRTIRRNIKLNNSILSGDELFDHFVEHLDSKVSNKKGNDSKSGIAKIAFGLRNELMQATQMMEEIADTLQSSVYVEYVRSGEHSVFCGDADEYWGSTRTALDAEINLITRMTVDPNNTQVSLSQIRFTYNQSPAEFGRALLLTIFRLAFEESKARGSVESKQGKTVQKVFTNFISIFTRFLLEERFGGNENVPHEDSRTFGKSVRLLLLLVEVARNSIVRNRMPYFLKALYEESVISEEEIISLNNYMKSENPNTAGIQEIISTCGFGVTDVPSCLFETWDRCEPFLKALYDAE